ncbi:MAG: VOC family protein [Actinobacteria bacterium]|nr:VOC family protein [Actinomycetota bacterium]
MGIPGVRGTDHIGFTVPDLDEAENFLVDVLGAELVLEQPGACDRHGDMMQRQFGVDPRAEIIKFRFYRMQFGSDYEVFEWKAKNQRTTVPLNSDIGGHHLALYVDDIDIAVDYLRDRNVDVMGDIVPSGGGSKGNRFIYFRSPWGMQYELVCYPDGKEYEKHTDKRLWTPVNPGQ